MNNLEIKGEENTRNGRRKQQEAAQTGDRLKCIAGKEEELAGKLQKRFGKGEDEIIEAIDEAEEETK